MCQCTSRQSWCCHILQRTAALWGSHTQKEGGLAAVGLSWGVEPNSAPAGGIFVYVQASRGGSMHANYRTEARPGSRSRVQVWGALGRALLMPTPWAASARLSRSTESYLLALGAFFT